MRLMECFVGPGFNWSVRVAKYLAVNDVSRNDPNQDCENNVESGADQSPAAEAPEETRIVANILRARLRASVRPVYRRAIYGY